MWKKLLIALVVLTTVFLLAFRYGVPYYANFKLHAFLETADTASYSALQFNYSDESLVLRDLYVIDSTGALAKHPVEINVKRIAIKGLSVWSLLKNRSIVADSVVVIKGAIKLPLVSTDTTKTGEPKPKKQFLKSVLLNHILLDSVAVNLDLDITDYDERAEACIYFNAKNVSIPLAPGTPLGWQGNLVLQNLYLKDSHSNLSKQAIFFVAKRFAIKGAEFNDLKNTHIAKADSVVLSKGSVTLRLPEKDTTQTEEENLKEKLVHSILLNHIFIDSLALKLDLEKVGDNERVSTILSFNAKDVSLPLVAHAPLGWQGNIILRNLYLKDTKGNLFKEPLFFDVDRVAVKGADFSDLNKTHIAKADSVVVGKGNIAMRLPAKKKTKTHAKEQKNKLLESLFLQHIYVGSVVLNLDLNPKIKNERIDATIAFKAQNVAVPFTAETPLAYENMQLNVTNVYVQPRKSIAYYKVKKLTLNSLKKSLQVEGFQMRQRISETKYAKHFGWDKAYIKMDVHKATIYGLPQKLRSLSKGMHLKKIDVIGLQTYLYKDKRLPHPNTPKPFPIEALSASKIPIRVDEIKITDSQLFYNENWREDYIPGRLSLTDINVTITNVNSTGPTKKGNFTVVKGNILFLNELELAVDWRFDLRKKGKEFTLDLAIGSAPFNTMNSFTENTMGLHFKSGNLLGGRLLVTGDKTSGHGTLDLFYEDMKLNIINKQSHERGFIKWAAGGIANLVVRNNNLKDQKPKQGIVYAEPLPDRAIYGYIVKLFFSGFQDLALGSKNEKKAEARKNGTTEKTKKSRKSKKS